MLTLHIQHDLSACPFTFLSESVTSHFFTFEPSILYTPHVSSAVTYVPTVTFSIAASIGNSTFHCTSMCDTHLRIIYRTKSKGNPIVGCPS